MNISSLNCIFIAKYIAARSLGLLIASDKEMLQSSGPNSPPAHECIHILFEVVYCCSSETLNN
jgi:hypothetical protein